VADVFISYKSERRAAAEHLAEVLADYGYSVWWDYGLVSGRDFGAQIEQELRAAKAVIVLWCSMAVSSEWVKEEAALAKRLNKVIPTFIERVELPLGFSLSQTLDLSEWDGAPQSNKLERLVRDVAQFVGRAPKPNLEGLDRTERAWRRFGAPALRDFALIGALERKLPPRTLPGELGGGPPLPPPAPEPGPRLPIAVVATGAVAVVAVIVLALMYFPVGPRTQQYPDMSVAPAEAVPTEAAPMASAPTEAASAAEPRPAVTQPAPSVAASASPNIVAPGGSTEIAVFVTGAGNAPLAGAQVVLEAGGIFLNTGTTRVVGFTDQGGVFRTRWSTYAVSAYTGDMGYAVSVEVTKDGYETARGETTIFIRMP